MSEPESSRAASNRWLIYAGIVAVVGIALYFIDRPVWYVFRTMFDAGTALCLIMWQRLGGFARGWVAAERHRVARR